MKGILQILILDDERGGIKHLHNALSVKHSVTWTRTIIEANKAIDLGEFDVIICGTHLLNESMFEFLKDVRDQNKQIPFVCFRSGASSFAKANDSQIEYTSQLMGANAYIVADNETDTKALLAEVEAALEPVILGKHEA
jgi:DNA-binding NtrC family response regulator